jgi:hypothetical protein
VVSDVFFCRLYIHPREFRPHVDSISVGDEPDGEAGFNIASACSLEIAISSLEDAHVFAIKAATDYLRTRA